MPNIILSQVLLLAGIAAISTSAAPATSPRLIPALNETYIIVLREFQDYTGAPLPSTYNNSKARVEKVLKRYSSSSRRYYNLWERYSKLYPRNLRANYLNRNYPMVGQYSPLYIGFVAELNARALTRVSTTFCID